MARYPLEPLARVRASEVDAAARRLAETVADREAAEAALAAARAGEARHLDQAAAVDRHEAIALASGVLRAADLARRDAFLVGVSLEAAAHAARVAEAEAKLAAARAHEDDARAALADRKAQADVVLRDRARFDERARQVREAIEDENAEDAARVGKAQWSGGRGS